MKTRILTVTNAYWESVRRPASVKWILFEGCWTCVGGDVALGYMLGLTPEQAKAELEKLGAKWRWSQVTDQEVKSVS